MNAREIRHRLIGKVISDGAHWRYYLKSNGAIDGEERSRPRKGRWKFSGDRLCIIIYRGAAPNECWEVSQQGPHLVFGTNGSPIYWVKVKPPPL